MTARHESSTFNFEALFKRLDVLDFYVEGCFTSNEWAYNATSEIAEAIFEHVGVVREVMARLGAPVALRASLLRNFHEQCWWRVSIDVNGRSCDLGEVCAPWWWLDSLAQRVCGPGSGGRCPANPSPANIDGQVEAYKWEHKER
jgi:hypothetical protein